VVDDAPRVIERNVLEVNKIFLFKIQLPNLLVQLQTPDYLRKLDHRNVLLPLHALIQKIMDLHLHLGVVEDGEEAVQVQVLVLYHLRVDRL